MVRIGDLIQFGTAASTHAKAPAGLPTAADVHAMEIPSLYRHENSCDLTDPLKGSEGPPGIPKAQEENPWS